MLALIMAGGCGSRLNAGEKPLVNICGNPMIYHVIRAFEDAGCELVIVSSPKTPFTKNWCRTNGFEIYNSGGAGYVEDMIECVLELGEENPLMTCVSDLPCINSAIISVIIRQYLASGKDACSTWIPSHLFQRYGCSISYTEVINGVSACPVGVNILSGDRITEEQDELKLILDELRLIFNVNTPEELSRVRKFLCTGMND